MVARVVGFFVGILVVGAILRGLERLFPARRAGVPIRTRLLARERLTDLAHLIFHQVVTQPVQRVAGVAVVVVFVVAFGLPRDPSHLLDVWHSQVRLARLPLVLQVPLALVFVDVVAYWIHRALHAGWLWRFHAVHHSARELDWLAGARNHPVGEIFSGVVMMSLLLLVGFDPRVLAVTAPLGLYAILLHANVRWGAGRLRYVIATPLFHRWHHAHPDALPEGRKGGVNFAALLPVWDLLFGTYYTPAAQPASFGADEPVPARFLGQLCEPFRSGSARKKSDIARLRLS
jgi:sterol desaturase/sphingolipid hydroxylase (fatty acid hydroxylase superfamily)